MSILSSGARSNLVRAGAVAAVAVASVGVFAGTAQAVNNPTMTLSAYTGPSSGGNTLTLSVLSTATTKFQSGNVSVVFAAASGAAAAFCPGTSTTTATTAGNTTTTVSHSTTTSTAGQLFSGTIRTLSTTKITATVPDLRVVNLSGAATAGPTSWAVCAYAKAVTTPVVQALHNDGTPASGTVGAGAMAPAAGGSVALIGRAVYTVDALPTIASSNAILPATGASLGGQTVTITGTNFPTAAPSSTNVFKATLDGVDLTNITPISQFAFTATTPAHPASSAVALTVTTNGGTASKASAYTYKNGLTSVSPATTPAATPVDLDITGTGFNSLNFVTTDGSATNSTDAHVYLVRGAYNTTSAATGTNTGVAWTKTGAQLAECTNVAVIGDTELICTITPTGGAITWNAGTGTGGSSATVTNHTGNLANDTYTVTVVNNGAPDITPSYKTELSSGATFTVSDF